MFAELLMKVTSPLSVSSCWLGTSYTKVESLLDREPSGCTGGGGYSGFYIIMPRSLLKGKCLNLCVPIHVYILSLSNFPTYMFHYVYIFLRVHQIY